MKNPEKCKSCSQRVSLIGIFACLFLATFKLIVGFFGKSHALVASGMCNLSDLSSSVVVLLGMKYSRRRPNKRYPYGYGKLESVIQISMSILMIAGNILILTSSFFLIAKRSIVVPHMIVFFTAILSATVNGLIYKFASCGARELNSPALRAHAEHNKIDVAGSLAVAVGVLAARVGLHWADPLIAIFECVHVIHGSYRILKEGLGGVMDESVPQVEVDNINHSLLEIKEIKRVRRIRARQAGHKILLDIAVELAPDMTVLESKRISKALKAHLRKANKHIGNILVQIIPVQQVEL